MASTDVCSKEAWVACKQTQLQVAQEALSKGRSGSFQQPEGYQRGDLIEPEAAEHIADTSDARITWRSRGIVGVALRRTHCTQLMQQGGGLLRVTTLRNEKIILPSSIQIASPT